MVLCLIHNGNKTVSQLSACACWEGEEHNIFKRREGHVCSVEYCIHLKELDAFFDLDFSFWEGRRGECSWGQWWTFLQGINSEVTQIDTLIPYICRLACFSLLIYIANSLFPFMFGKLLIAHTWLCNWGEIVHSCLQEDISLCLLNWSSRLGGENARKIQVASMDTELLFEL